MKLFVLGATGHTGLHIVDIALSRSHEVTAFARSPEKIAIRDPNLKVVAGNPLDVNQLTQALGGHDAILSSIGVRPPQAFRPHSTVQECAASTMAAMTRTGVNRFVFVSAAVLFPIRGLRYAFFRWMLQHISRDLGTAEEIVRATSFDWTIVLPPRLTNRGNAGYRLARNALPEMGNVATFRALATFMIDAAERHSHIREVVGLAK